ncbi:uncharacterized protein LOC144030967 [Festucalex cinctus]
MALSRTDRSIKASQVAPAAIVGEQVDNDRSVSKLSSSRLFTLLHSLTKSVQLPQDQQQQQQSLHRSQEKLFSVPQQIRSDIRKDFKTCRTCRWLPADLSLMSHPRVE